MPIQFTLPSRPCDLWLGADATHADDRVEAPGSDLAHAVLDTEAPLLIGISRMGSFVDERFHRHSSQASPRA
jgi:hypothetical protein